MQIQTSQHLKILLISHSSDLGGGQKGLLYLLDQLMSMGHQCSVLVPKEHGQMNDACQRRAIDCYYFSYQWALPIPSNDLLIKQRPELDAVANELKPKGINLIISNTIVLLVGAFLAEKLSIHHAIYVHELIKELDSNLRPRGICANNYIRLLNHKSSGWITCSQKVRDSLLEINNLSTIKPEVLYPYSWSHLDVTSPSWARDNQMDNSPWHLVLIGEQSRRKHPAFGVLVLNALRLRGHNIMLDHYGIESDGAQDLMAMINRLGMGPFVTLHGWTANPISALPSKSLHLITAKSEPFGLTIPECIEKGIPVIASRCGGPEELLPEEWLYPVDDLAACVQAIETFLADLKASDQLFNSCTTQLNIKLNQQKQKESLSLWLTKILGNPLHRDGPDSNIEKLWRLSQFDASYRLSPTDLAPLVRQASNLDDAQWDSLIGAEQKRPGSAVAIEMAQYGLCAHANSPELSALYKDGNSFLIELLIGHGKGGRAEMSAFVMASLLNRLQPEASKVLAFGDGLGIDSLQLLNAGYEVDYVDMAGSRTAHAAKIIINTHASTENIDRVRFLNKLPIDPLYDAIVCLEVVEHVEVPLAFLQSLCKTLKHGGFLVISECFSGVEPQWQTHLHTNLKYGGHLPAMLAQFGLELVDANLNPAAKPLVFRRCLQGELPSWSWTWNGLAC